MSDFDAACARLALTLANCGLRWPTGDVTGHAYELACAGGARNVLIVESWFEHSEEEGTVVPWLAKYVARVAERAIADGADDRTIKTNADRATVKEAILALALLLPPVEVETFVMSDDYLTWMLFALNQPRLDYPTAGLASDATFEEFEADWTDIAFVEDAENRRRLAVTRSAAEAQEHARWHLNYGSCKYDDLRVGTVGAIPVTRERFGRLLEKRSRQVE